MTDRAYEPANPNVFDQFDPDRAAPIAVRRPVDKDNSFEKFNPFPGEDVGPPAVPKTSATGAFLHGAERSAIPAAGGLAVAGLGAELGAAAGLPFAPLTAGLSVPIGGFLGGLGAFYFGSSAVAHAQDWALSKLPDSWREALGQDDRQQKLEEQQHPTAAFLGGLAPYALTLRPGRFTTKGAALPENATAFERIMANPVTGRLFAGTLMGGMELGQEAIAGQSPNWSHIAIATGFGLVFNKPTRLGERLTEVGARPARYVLGRAEPTVAQASDLNTIGPGVTEEVHQGAHERSPGTAASAHDMRRAEQGLIEPPPVPDIPTLARRMEPDIFTAYDELTARRATLRTWIDTLGGSDSAYAHLRATEAEMAALEPRIQAAYRRAAEHVGVPPVEEAVSRETAPAGIEEPVVSRETPALPEPVSRETPEGRALEPTKEAHAGIPREAAAAPGEEKAPAAAPAGTPAGQRVVPGETPAGAGGIRPEAAPIEAQRAAIIADVTRQLTEAGRPAAEAQAAAQLIAARYIARAAWFKGALGTAQELYEREGARIQGTRGAAPAPAAAPARPPLLPPEDTGAALAPGQENLVLRVGSAGGRLAQRNGGNALAIADHLVRHEGFETPKAAGGLGDTLSVYGVRFEGEPGPYQTQIAAGAMIGQVGRRVAGQAVSYAFPAEGTGYRSRLLARIPVEDVRAELRRMSYADADEAGTLATAQAIRKVVAEEARGRQEVRDLIDTRAEPAQIAEHPVIQRAQAENDRRPHTTSLPGYGTPEFEASREFNFAGQRVVGYDAAVAHLTDQARAYSTAGPVEPGRQATLVLGPPASGKSRLSERIARERRAAIADPDDAKVGLPQYDGGIGTSAVHEESGEIARRVLSNLVAQGDNLVIPRVGGNIESVRGYIDALAEAGYSVDILNMTVAPAEAYRRMIARYLSTGRIIGSDYFHQVDGNPQKNYYTLKGADNVREAIDIDNNTRTPRVLDGGTTELARLLGVGEPRGQVPGRGDQGRLAPGEAAAREVAAAPAAPIASEIPNAVQSFSPADLKVDASRFQFKEGGDEAGVTDRLKGVTQWDPIKAGMVLVWQSAGGEHFIVDGHQRYGLAQRIEAADPAQRPQLLARVLRESEGVTDADARTIAALKNIAEGTGTAVDAAKVLREHPERAGELPPRSELFRQAQGLVNLSPDAFRMVINDVVPPNYAAIVGRLVPADHELQTALLGLLAKTDPANAIQAEAIVRQGIEAGVAKKETGAQGGLFGDEDVAESLYLERAKVLDRALKEIKQDKKIFSVLTREQQSIEKAGNVLAAEVNQKRAAADAQALQILQTLANRKGPVSDALATAAQRVRQDGKYLGATRQFVQAIRELMERHELARLADGVERGPTHVGDENRAGVVERAPERVGEGRQDETGERVLELMQRVRRDQEPPNLFAEREAEGQMQFPGAERAGMGEMAQRGAEAPLRPRVAQKPMDIGLFGDAAAQKELFQEREFPQSARGKIRISAEDVRPTITLMRDANASTFIHETGHDFLEQLMRDAEHPVAPEQLRTDASTVRDWLGAKPEGDITVRQHEKFARGFEQYVREGIAPSKELVSVFAKFKQWLMNIYQTIKGLGMPISDDIKSVFDRMLAAEPQRTVVAERAEQPSLADIHEADARETEGPQIEAAADLIRTERARYAAEPPPDIAHEITPAVAKVEEARAAAGGAAVEPGAEARGGEGGPQQVARGGGEPGLVPEGGGVGARRGEVGEGGGRPETEGVEPAGAAARPGVGEGARDSPLSPSPADLLGPAESRLIGKEGNVRAENITSVDDFVRAIDESSERIAAAGQVQGRATMGQMMDLADEILIDHSRITEAGLAKIFGGVANLAPKIWALRQAVRDSAQIVSGLAKRYAETNSQADLAAALQAMARHDMMQSTLSGVTTETGRGLGMAFRNLEGWKQAEDLGTFLQENTGRTLFQLQQIAKMTSRLDTPGKVSKFLRDAQQRSFAGMLLEYWINGLISGPATHTTYTVGNMILSLEKAGPETAMAAAIGRLQAMRGREGETVRFGEVAAQLGRAVTELPRAVSASIEAFRSGMTTLLPGEQGRVLTPFQGDTVLQTARTITTDPVAWRDVGAELFGSVRGVLDGIKAGAELIAAGGEKGAPLLGWHFSPLGQIPDIAIRGVPAFPVGSAIRIPGRFIAAIHSFFRTTNFSMEGGAQSYRAAANEGLTGTTFDKRVGEVYQNPTPEQMEARRFIATELTLMGQGGAITAALSRLVNARAKLPIVGEVAILKFIDPFVHISSNIIKQSIVERTPLGILSAEIRADLMGHNGNIAQDTAMARMLCGTLFGIGFGSLAAAGYASGSGPSDPKEAAMWRLAGNQAHSVRIGDTWYDMHRLGPMGMLLSIAADLYEVAEKAHEGEFLEAASHFQHAITQNILDESFMRGPADLIKAVEDPGRYGEAYIRSTLSSFVPYSVGMAQVARAVDPYTRQARTVTDAMINKIPFWSKTLLPRRDIWGEEMPSREAFLAPGVTAIYETRMSRDPVNLAMLDLGISPGKLMRKIRNVDLDDQQYDDFTRIAGRMTKMRLDAIVRSPDWRLWPNHIKRDVINETVRQSREAGRGILMMKFPQIIRDATAAKLERLED